MLLQPDLIGMTYNQKAIIHFVCNVFLKFICGTRYSYKNICKRTEQSLYSENESVAMSSVQSSQVTRKHQRHAISCRSKVSDHFKRRGENEPNILLFWRGRRRVKLLVCLCQLLCGRFKEFVVSEGSNKVIKSLILVFDSGGLAEGGNLELSGFLREGQHGFSGLLQIKGDGGDGFGEPRFVTTIGTSSPRGLSDGGSSRDSPVVGRDGSELTLATITGLSRYVAVLATVIQIVLSFPKGSGGFGSERCRGKGSDSASSYDECGDDLHCYDVLLYIYR
mmetsp:Transcript_9752/g.20412  ORF Transcript_9752/g.20412 Transcript_9752/m.20412 type:complete len:278 (+) Transcript_9752:706-1539(+)